MRTIEHWIDNRPTPGRSPRRGPVFDPATGEQRAEVALADSDDLETAVLSSVEAFSQWSETSLAARTKILFAFRELVNDHIDQLATTVSDEHGKVLSDARGEVQRGLEVVEFACGIPQLLKGDYSDQVSTGIDVYSYRQPLGVVAGITPFNFPVMVPMWMHPIAIACGNAFLLKPSERDPSASLEIARLWAEAGLPPGVFNVLNGDRGTVEAILDHSDIAAVSFVGSTPVARQVHARASATGKRVQALGGAKNHAVVLPDADLDFAAEHLVAAAFGSAGERCMAISAAVTVGGMHHELAKVVAERAAKIRVGPGRDETSDMGPVITSEARERVIGYVGRSQAQGASLVLDGRSLRVPGHEHGFFVGPSVVSDVTPSMEIYRDEVFGPVLSLLACATIEEAVALINSNPYGNGTAVFTASGEAARRFHRGVMVGMVGINVPIPVPMAYYSFGGWKDSLFGERHMHGPEGIVFYTRGKVVTSRWPQQHAKVSASYYFPTAQ